MPDKVGQQLGNYRLIRLLGEGGFAQVYLGEHIYLGTQAAIKVLNTELTSDNVEWFRSEARTIARLVHPNIVRVLDYGVDSMTPFLVLDYAPNGSLRQQYPGGMRVPLPTIISNVKQVAGALQFAHDEKLIHRDVKPENMLLGARKEVLLSDFGLALIAQSTRYQDLQNVAGTITYMAPEQIQGKPRPASDQYSLGVIVYEWLSGERLFQGSLTEIISQQLAVPPPPLSGKIPGISPAIERVVMTALEKDPKKRFASVREFALALEQASQADLFNSAQAGTSVVSQVEGTPQEVTIPPLRPITAPVVSDPTFPATPFPTPVMQTAPVGTLVCSYRGHRASVSSLSWSPDGSRIVSASNDQTVHVWDTSTGNNIHQFQDASEAVRVVAWSYDGLRIATAGADALVRVWDVVTNRLVVTYRGHTQDAVNTMAWSPAQQLLASAGNDSTVQVWDTNGGQLVSVYRGHAGGVYAVAWSFDGKMIISGGSDASVQVWQSFTGSNVALYRSQPAGVLSVAWNPVLGAGVSAAPSSAGSLDRSSDARSDQRVACGREDGTVQMWDIASGREVMVYRHVAPVYVVAWSPNGKRFAFASDDQTVQVWDTMSNLKLFTFQHSASVRAMAWSPDGKYIASSGGTDIQVWVAP